MADQRSGNYIWVAWLTHVMAGDTSCLWAPWFKTHYTNYEKAPSDFDLAQWQMDHTRQLNELVMEREQAGEKVRIQGQNRFRFERPPDLVVAGKPDLVARSVSGATVYDVKTGQPRLSDEVQVMLYMYCIPMCMPEYQSARLDGCVVYTTHRVPIPASKVGDQFKDNFEYWLDVLASEAPARKVPSEQECRYCDIARADCAERLE